MRRKGKNTAQEGATKNGRTAARWPLCRMVKGPLDTWLYRFAFSFVPALWRMLFRMTIQGVENIPLQGAVVLACNHRSNLDPFFLGSACPRQVHFMAKAELWRVKALGRLVEMMGAFPVKRGEADREAVKQAMHVLAAGGVLGLFPEGRRHRDLSQQLLEDILPGVSLFSLRPGVVTIPVVMKGTEKVVSGGLFRLPKVRVIIGRPLELPPESLPKATRATLTVQRLREDLLALLSECDGEIPSESSASGTPTFESKEAE